jgi:cell division protein FtsA
MMNSIENKTQSAVRIERVPEKTSPPNERAHEPAVQAMPVAAEPEEQNAVTAEVEVKEQPKEVTSEGVGKNFFNNYFVKLKDFLDNAE